MKRGLILALLLLPSLLTGCADKYIHIYALDASSSIFPGVDAVAGGCLVDIKGDVTDISITYNGDNCTVDTRKPLPMSGDL